MIRLVFRQVDRNTYFYHAMSAEKPYRSFGGGISSIKPVFDKDKATVTTSGICYRNVKTCLEV